MTYNASKSLYNEEVEKMGAKILAQYTVFGPYDLVNILEAPDNETDYF
ncbi:MAG: GYD domain-containing protein [Candidatus Syntropharchaeia archaeon]